MEYPMCSVLAVVLTSMVLVETSPGESTRMLFNETAPPDIIYLLRKLDKEGVLSGIQAYITHPMAFSLQIWAEIKLRPEDHGSEGNGPRTRGPESHDGDPRGEPGPMGSQIFTLIHEKRVDGKSLRTGINQLSFSETTEHDQSAHCPYVYEGDFVGVLSTEGDLPIPYMKHTHQRPQTWVSDIANRTDRLLAVSFEPARISFAVEDPKVERVPRPPRLQKFASCREGRRWDNPGPGQFLDIGGVDTRDTTKEPEPERDTSQEIQLPTSLYVSMGTVAAVAAVAIIASVVMCFRFRTHSKFNVLTRDGLVPVLTGPAPGSPSFKQDPRLSVRNPVYGDNCGFLRSISIAGSDDSRVSYFVVPSSGVQPPDGFAHYEEVRFVRPSSSRRASQKNESTKSTDPNKPHTYLDLLPDEDDSGVDSMNHSGASVEDPVAEEHRPVKRAPSGPYCKIDD